MSIERTGATGPAAKKWRVRWRDADGPHSRRVFTKREAIYLHGQIQKEKALGLGVDLNAGTEALHEFVTERWWPNYAQPQLAESTRAVRKQHWNAYIHPLLGHVRLRDINAEHSDLLNADLVARSLAPLTRRSVLGTYGNILNKAAQWGRIPKNPARGFKRPGKGERQRPIRPLTPVHVEALRAELDQRGAVIVSLLAYEGIRPRELRRLEWPDIRERTIHVRPEAAKPNTPGRTVPLLEPVLHDLQAWRLKQGRPETGLVIPASRNGPRNGRQWSENAYHRWQSTHFEGAASRAGLSCVPYDLRHSFISLMIQSGKQILEVARMAGHSPTMTLETYGHLFDEFDPSERVDPVAEILKARGHDLDKDRAVGGRDDHPASRRGALA